MTFRYPDWSDAAVTKNPYAHYQNILRQQPFGFDRSTNSWICARYSDCLALLKDPRLTAERTTGYRAVSAQMPISTKLIDSIEHWISFVDGPRHQLLRPIILKIVSQYVQKNARPVISKLLIELTSKFEGLTEFDAVRDFAQPLPLAVILHLIGLPPEDGDFLLRKSSAMAYFFERSSDPRLVSAATQAFGELDEYLRFIIKIREENPRDDLISKLLAAQIDDARLTTEVIIGNVLFLLAAGHETTANLIASTLGLVLIDPIAANTLRQRPDLVSAAVDETLRLEPPVQRVGRLVTETFEWHGQSLQAGQWVVMLLAAANRDPEVYTDPDTFNLERSSKPHLAFSHGAHYCAGAQLGRLEAIMAVDYLLRCWPDLILCSRDLDFAPNQTFRSLRHLHLRLHGQKTFQKPKITDQKAYETASK